MISGVSGKLIEKQNNYIIIEVNGVSYQVYLPATVMQRIEESLYSEKKVNLKTFHYIQTDPAKGIKSGDKVIITDNEYAISDIISFNGNSGLQIKLEKTSEEDNPLFTIWMVKGQLGTHITKESMMKIVEGLMIGGLLKAKKVENGEEDC